MLAFNKAISVNGTYLKQKNLLCYAINKKKIKKKNNLEIFMKVFIIMKGNKT